jgi:putative peptidoglycan lipid II flippase
MSIFQRLFKGQQQTVKQASILLAFTALLSNVLGLARNLIFYRLVPPGQLDIYYASFRLADFLFNLLIFGAITSSFIPVITEMISLKKEKIAHEVTNQLITWSTIFFIVLIAILSLFMRQIIHFIVPGFGSNRLEMTISLSRLMLLQTIFFSWSFIIGGLLNSYNRFTTYALAPLIYNLAIIIGGLLAPKFGIISISYSVVIGSFLHFLIQYYEAQQFGFHFYLNFQFTDKLKEIIFLMIPRGLSQGMSQIVLVVYTGLASTLQAGSIAIFSGINDLQTTPTVIIGNSLATAILPTLTAIGNEKQKQAGDELLTKVIRSSIFLSVPIIALLFILRAQIIRLYFGIGGASWELTNIAIGTFTLFLIGIVPATIVAILARVFYSFKDTKTPMWVSISTSLLAIFISYVGIYKLHFNVGTLALSESCISMTQMVAYLIILAKKQHINLFNWPIMQTVWHSSLASIISGFTTWLTLRFVNLLYNQTSFLSTTHSLTLMIQGIIAGCVGILTYLIYSKYKMTEELTWLQTKLFSLKKS